MIEENWTPLLEYANYEISDLSRVRFVGDSSYKRKYMRKMPSFNQIIKPVITDGGRYLSIRVYPLDFSKQKIIKLHRAVFFSFNPDIKQIAGHEVDHISEDRFDCRLVNLQYISHSANIGKHYKTKPKSSKHTGVYWNKRQNVWSTMIRHKGVRHFLGNFIDQDKAGLAYQVAFENLQSFDCIDAQTL